MVELEPGGEVVEDVNQILKSLLRYSRARWECVNVLAYRIIIGAWIFDLYVDQLSISGAGDNHTYFKVDGLPSKERDLYMRLLWNVMMLPTGKRIVAQAAAYLAEVAPTEEK